MHISKIIYYTRENDTNRSLSLRNLCTKDVNQGLETIFYMVKDATDIQDLLKKFAETYFEYIELECDKPSYIKLKVIDVNNNTNYLKLKKINTHGGKK